MNILINVKSGHPIRAQNERNEEPVKRHSPHMMRYRGGCSEESRRRDYNYIKHEYINEM